MKNDCMKEAFVRGVKTSGEKIRGGDLVAVCRTEQEGCDVF